MFPMPPWPALLAALLLASLALLALITYGRMRRQRRRHLMANIEQLKLLRRLLADFQRHRGLSAGLLAGDEKLRPDLTSVRQRLDQSIATASELHTTHDRAWRALIEQWQRLKADNSCDAGTNLLKHHALIRNTIFLFEDVAGELDLSAGKEELSYLNAIWREVVQAAEWTGQARALGTAIAAASASTASQRVRLRFLHQKIEQLSRTAFASLGIRAPRNLNLHACEAAVTTFMHCLEQELLEQERPKIEAKSYFEQATLAINELLALVDAALNDLQRAHKGH